MAAARQPNSSPDASSSDPELGFRKAEGLPTMAEILVLAEHDGETVKKVTLELVTLARRFGEPAVVWTGSGAEPAQARLAEYGAAKVYVASGPEFDDYVVAPKAELLAELASQKSPAAVLVANTAEGREIGGRLAVKTGWGILTDVVGLDEDLTADQVIFGGAINVKSKVRSGTPIIAVRPNAISPEPAAGDAAIEPVSITVSDAAKLAGTRISSRSARPARRCRHSCMSRSGYPGRSSTAPECRPRRRSWWSIRIPRRRSSSSPTSGSWETCSRSYPNWSRRSRSGRAEPAAGPSRRGLTAAASR